jgi:hypothetical protein
VHTYNPSYFKGKYQEDHSLKPTQPNTFQDPFSKITTKNRASGVAQVVKCLPSMQVSPELKPQYHKKKKKRKKKKSPVT